MPDSASIVVKLKGEVNAANIYFHVIFFYRSLLFLFQSVAGVLPFKQTGRLYPGDLDHD